METRREDRAGLRILRFLAKGKACLEVSAAAGRMLLDGGDRGVVAVDVGVIDGLKCRALAIEENGMLQLTDKARATLKVAVAAADLLQPPRQERGSAVIVTQTGREAVTVNHAESPLALLRRRKGKDGRPFLDAREVGAGERLRADYERGHLAPRLGIDWSVAGSAGRRRSDAGGSADLTDAALAARRRVERAIEAVGPELSGVLIDVCCFLKGLEQVEMERGWPVRSAKIVLKTALAALARHYEPQQSNQGRTSTPQTLHWGAPDYRPVIDRR